MSSKLDWDKVKAQDRMRSGVTFVASQDFASGDIIRKKKKNRNTQKQKQKRTRGQWLNALQDSFDNYVKSKSNKNRLAQKLAQAVKAYPSIKKLRLYKEIILHIDEDGLN